MVIKLDGLFPEPRVAEPGSFSEETPHVSDSKELQAGLTSLVDSDSRGKQGLRDIHARKSAMLLARPPRTKARPAIGADRVDSSTSNPFRSNPFGSDRRTVLVAEDDTATRLLIQNWLQGWGYKVVIAHNGAEAWSALQQEHPPALVIMDWMMPGIEGVELSRRLRHEQRDYYQYILLITGKNNKGDIGHALESGVDDYLVKPFDKDELKARLTAANRILELQDNLVQAREDLLDQATKDGLTGVWNRGALLDLFQRELDRASRVRTPTGLLILDLDHFKNVNDTYGHLIGDLVLKDTAARLKSAVRSYDLVGRYGGEEFLIAFPNCDGDQLCKIAEKIRLSVAGNPVLVNSVEIPITLSIGAIAVMPDDRSAGNIVATADIALYRAKNTGRNRTVYCERSWEEVLQSKDTNHGFCAQCALGMSKKCEVQFHVPIDLDQRIAAGTMSNGLGLPQIPILSTPAVATPLLYRP